MTKFQQIVCDARLSAGAASLALALAFVAEPAEAQDTAVTSTPGGVVAPGTASTTGDASPGAMAAPAAAADSNDDRDVIIVTGSRIARPDLQSSVPVALVNAASIEQTGSTNVQDTLAQLPSVGSNISRTSSNFSSTGNGQATINLRNLGSSRTLALINGRRSVGIPGSSSFDVNNIPADLIDRVEVVTGGASAVYGSEAVAGVVNFVLKDHLDGIRVRGQNTLSDKGDSARQFVSVTAGQSFGDDRGHIIVNGSFDNDHGLRSRDRGFSAKDTPSRSSYAAQGLFSIDGAFSAANRNTFTFDGGNNLKQYQGANIDGYNRAGDRYLSLPVQRYQAAVLGNYEIVDGVTIYGEGEYNKTKSNAGLEPSAIANTGPGAALNFDGSALAGIPLTNPYIPQGILNAVAAYNAAGAAAAALPGAAPFTPATTLQFRRRSNDIFSRSNRDDRDYYRGVIGVKGDITDKIHADLYYEHSQVHDFTTSQAIFAPNYGAALNSVRDASGNIVCADAAARAAGCVPINIFGFNTVSAAAAAFLRTDPGPAGGGIAAGNSVDFTYNAHVKQDVLSGTISGDLFDLPGGAVSIATGGEYRRETSREVFDPYTQAGLSSGNQLSNTVGKFNVKEGFVEVVVPILKDRPFFHYLGLEGAARYADYSTVGGVWSYKVGADFAPTSDIRFRGAYAQATRAPNIGELFSAQSQTFPALVDPCDQGGGGGDDAVAANANPANRIALSAACKAIAGVAASAGGPNGFTYTTSQIQTIDGLTGGNINLKQETARTITAGGVFTPSFARNLSLTVDYYRIKVKNAIGIIGQQVSVEQCLIGGDPIFCSNVVRNAQGFVTRVNAINLNTGSYLVSGIDVQGRYKMPLDTVGLPGSLDLSVYWNHLLKQEQTPFPGGPVQDEKGQLDCYSCGRLGSGFKDRINTNFIFSLNAFTLSYRLNYLGPIVDNLDPSTFTRRVNAYFYHDLQARIGVGPDKRFEIYGGVNNLTDKKPPIFADTNPVTFPGTQTSADTYDLYGRLLYVGAEFKF